MKGRNQIDTELLRRERINQVRYNRYGEKGTCIGFEGNTSFRVIVLLESGETHTYRWFDFDHGRFHAKGSIRKNERRQNSQGSYMTIQEYRSENDIDVIFDSGYLAEHTRYSCFKSGEIKDLLFPVIYNVGYEGVGQYNSRELINGINARSVWHHMLRRCYSPEKEILFPSYKDCIVDDRWHNFQTFAEWINQNGYVVDNQRMELDKDILYKGNKVYGPDTCMIVPSEINILFVKAKSKRGEYPIGVSKNSNKYYVNIGRKRLGNFSASADSAEEAFQIYKEVKEDYIKYIADIYKNVIPKKLYDSMYNYRVEITD